MSWLVMYEFAAALSCAAVGASSKESLRSTGMIFVYENVPGALIVFSGSVTTARVSGLNQKG